MPESTQPKIDLRATIWRLVRMSGRSQVFLYLALLMAACETAVTIASSLTLGRFINAALSANKTLLFHYMWLTLGLGLALIPIAFLRARWIGAFSERLLAGLRAKIADRATVLPMDYLEARHTGDLLSVVNTDMTRIKELTANHLLNAFSQSLSAVAALVTLFVISWPLALVSTLLVPLMMMVMSKLSQPVANRTQEMQESIGETVAVAQDGLGGLMVTRAFNLAAIIDERFRRVNQQAQGKGLQLARLQAVSDGAGMIFGFLPFLITLGFGGWLTINGYLTFGFLLSFVNLLNFVANPLSSLPPTLSSISEAGGAAQRTFQILDQPVERGAGTAFLPVPQMSTASLEAARAEAVRFDHISFSYGEEPVLSDVSFSVQAGQTVAVVGPSGGGKSTLLKLLLGFYPVEQGQVFLFGQNLNDWSLSAMRQQMAFVAQDTYLFPVTIAENIACGRPGAGQAEIEQAARMANIHDYIVTLPDGYRTLTGERGARLSGGQRQRISLARAILKDAPVLLLDEPTSALDSESEALVQEALERFMVGRTTIVIAHRLSTIRGADRVLVLEDGRIVEEGNHDELMLRAGRYRDLYVRQLDNGNGKEASHAALA